MSPCPYPATITITPRAPPNNNNNNNLIFQLTTHEGDGDTNLNRRARYSQQKIGTGTRGFGNKRVGGDHPNQSINEIG